MANRTLYTKSEVNLPGGGSEAVGANTLMVNGVTSATFTKDTPREQVTVFGKKGQVDTVQNESTTATIEFVFHPNEVQPAWRVSIPLIPRERTFFFNRTFSY